MTQPLFHPDEVRAQALAGFDRVGAGIYAAMPDQHREFFAALPYLFVATLDDQGWPVATLFSGPPGFLRTPDDTHLRISAPRRNDDPAQAALQSGKLVGALGLDFSNRRRNRANGVIGRTDKNRIEIEVRQSFGNCPQYIQRRELYPVAADPAPIEYLPALDAEAQALIRRADTFSSPVALTPGWRRAAWICRTVAASRGLSIWRTTACGSRTSRQPLHEHAG